MKTQVKTEKNTIEQKYFSPCKNGGIYICGWCKVLNFEQNVLWIWMFIWNERWKIWPMNLKDYIYERILSFSMHWFLLPYFWRWEHHTVYLCQWVKLIKIKGKRHFYLFYIAGKNNIMVSCRWQHLPPFSYFSAIYCLGK